MPENSGGIPKTIKIGDVEYKVSEHPELAALIEAGRKDEKEKLYSQIGGLTAEIKTLKDKEEMSKKDKEALKKLENELAVAKSDLEKAKAAGGEGSDDTSKGDDNDKSKDDKSKGGVTTTEIEAIVQRALKAQADQYEQKFASLKGEMTAEQVETYRKEQMKEYDGLLIPDLVPQGLKSKEEVNEAVKKALDTSKQFIRKDYTDKDGKTSQKTLAEIEELEKAPATPPSGGSPPPTYVPAGGTPPPPPPSGGGEIDSKSLVKDLKNLSPAEFAKNREAIRQEILKVGYGEDAAK